MASIIVDLQKYKKCVFCYQRIEDTDHIFDLEVFSTDLPLEVIRKITSRNNLLLQLSEEASKYQANDRGSYSTITDVPSRGHRFGARELIRVPTRASTTARRENCSQRTS